MSVLKRVWYNARRRIYMFLSWAADLDLGDWIKDIWNQIFKKDYNTVAIRLRNRSEILLEEATMPTGEGAFGINIAELRCMQEQLQQQENERWIDIAQIQHPQMASSHSPLRWGTVDDTQVAYQQQAAKQKPKHDTAKLLEEVLRF